mgnify:CR=1 FL=1
MKDWKYWIALRMVNGIGDVLFKALISRFGNPKEVFSADTFSLKNVEGVGDRTVKAIKEFSDWEGVEKEVNRIERLGIKILPFTDPCYPRNLTGIYNPPPLLYVKGNYCADDELSLAIVGTRNPDHYGRSVAEKLSGEVAELGITVVSGLARGVDSLAHLSALKRGGRTIAVLGSGLDVVYPPENKKLYERILTQGAVVSEFPLGTPPDSVNFPRRNRIISGLSLGVVVVQASDRSGSLITAFFALEQGRDVFAVPGNIFSKLSAGCNRLIKKGAKLVESVDDILEEIEAFRALRSKEGVRSDEKKVFPDSLSGEEKTLYMLLSDGTVHVDDVVKLSGLEPARVLSLLLSMELKGLVVQLPGKFFKVKRL